MVQSDWILLSIFIGVVFGLAPLIFWLNHKFGSKDDEE